MMIDDAAAADDDDEDEDDLPGSDCVQLHLVITTFPTLLLQTILYEVARWCSG